MKYLIVGLGNIGIKYENTRHNAGFMILDSLARESNFSFQDKRYGFVGEWKFKARQLYLLKPSTYMNLSGRAVNYWLKKLKLPPEKMLVLVDDIALPFGTLRMRKKGGPGGHNGLININDVLGTQHYPRLRFGIGNGFYPGQQVDYVLGEWSEEERKALPDLIDHSIEMIKSMVTIGIDRTMNQYNK